MHARLAIYPVSGVRRLYEKVQGKMIVEGRHYYGNDDIRTSTGL